MIRWLKSKLQKPRPIFADPQDDPLNLGQMLVRTGAITRSQLNGALVEVLCARNRGQHMRIGEALMATGALTPEQLRLYLDRQRAERSRKPRDVARYARTVAGKV